MLSTTNGGVRLTVPSERKEQRLEASVVNGGIDIDDEFGVRVRRRPEPAPQRRDQRWRTQSLRHQRERRHPYSGDGTRPPDVTWGGPLRPANCSRLVAWRTRTRPPGITGSAGASSLAGTAVWRDRFSGLLLLTGASASLRDLAASFAGGSFVLRRPCLHDSARAVERRRAAPVVPVRGAGARTPLWPVHAVDGEVVARSDQGDGGDARLRRGRGADRRDAPALDT